MDSSRKLCIFVVNYELDIMGVNLIEWLSQYSTKSEDIHKRFPAHSIIPGFEVIKYFVRFVNHPFIFQISRCRCLFAHQIATFAIYSRRIVLHANWFSLRPIDVQYGKSHFRFAFFLSPFAQPFCDSGDASVSVFRVIMPLCREVDQLQQNIIARCCCANRLPQQQRCTNLVLHCGCSSSSFSFRSL